MRLFRRELGAEKTNNDQKSTGKSWIVMLRLFDNMHNHFPVIRSNLMC